MENDKEKLLNKAQQPQEIDAAENRERCWLITRQKLSAASLFIGIYAALCSMSVLSPFFPNEALKKGVSGTVVGSIFSVYPLLGIIMGPISGKLVPRYGAKCILVAGLAVQGGTSVLFAFASAMPGKRVFIAYCFVMRILDALGSSGCVTAAIVIISAEFPDNLAAMMGAMGTIVGIGMATGPPLGGMLYTAGGFKLPFIVMGVLVLLAAFVLFFTLPSRIQAEEAYEEQSLLQTLKNPAVVMIAFNSTIGGMTLTFLDPILSPHLSQFGLDTIKIGFMFIISSGLYALLGPVLGSIADRTKKYNLMLVLGSFIGVVSFHLLGPIPLLDFVLPQRAVWLVCVALVLLGISQSLIRVPLMPRMLEIAKYNGMPQDASTTGIMSGIYTSTLNTGACAATVLAGVATQHFGFAWANAVMGFLMFFQGIVLIIFNMYSKTGGRPPTSAVEKSIELGEKEPILPRTEERSVEW